MRGQVDQQQAMFIAFDLEQFVPDDHPLRPIKRWCWQVLRSMRNDFDAAYSHTGRPGVPAEQLLMALLLQALYAIPSEIKLMEAIRYNMLYRWFLDLKVDDEVWTPECFSMNRQRFIEHDLVQRFFDQVVNVALKGDLISRDHFTVDGTLIRSLASHKSLEPTDGRSSPAQLERALRIFDTLIKVLEQRGHEVQLATRRPRSTGITVAGERITFSLHEFADKRSHELTDEEKRRRKDDPWGFDYPRPPKYDYFPSGKLRLRLNGVPGMRG